MKRFLLSTAAAAGLVLAAVPMASAQTPLYTSPPPPWINRSGSQQYKTIEVLPDRRVTFRILAPEAAGAQLSVGAAHADLHTYPMTKDAKGLWSVTIGPVDPEVYPYSFQIGGATVNRGNFEVHGASPALYDTQNVPHGTYNTQSFFSKALNASRELSVYVPPQYYSEPNRRFPVVYDYDDPGNSAGIRYRDLMDNLIAQKKAVPMLVVMLTDEAGGRNDAEAARMDDSRAMVMDILPLIESRYRTLPGRENRAMTGISHNGGATWTVGTHNLDKFGSLGLLSSGMFGGLLPDPKPGGFALYAPWHPEQIIPPFAKTQTNPATKLKLFYLAAGNIDPRVGPTKAAAEEFRKAGVDAVFESYPGGHQPKAFRPSFVSFVSKIFK